MKDLGLHGARRGKAFKTTIPDADASRPADLVDRQFVATRPNQLWVADITYVATWRGFAFVAFVIDVFSRRMVGRRVSTSLKIELVLDALEQAIQSRGKADELIHRSDWGTQYLSIHYSDRLTEAGITASVGSVGDSYEREACPRGVMRWQKRSMDFIKRKSYASEDRGATSMRSSTPRSSG